MTHHTQKNDRSVIVVGAGPVGLIAGLALRNLGLSATIMEAEPEGRKRPGSRAIYFHKATLIHLESIFPGLGYTLAKNGLVWPIKRTFFRGKEVFVKDYGPTDPNQLPPFTSLPQDRAEQFMFDACLQAGVEFVWNTPIRQVETSPDGVTLTTKAGDVWSADYVIGADGARSSVRTTAGMKLEGPRTNDTFLVVDVKEDEESPLPLERVFHYEHPAMGGRNVMFVPFVGGWRVDLQLLEHDDPEEYSHPEGVRRWIQKVMPAKYGERVTWVSTYRFHQVVADSFTDQHGKVLLAGEAAHLFAPFGARGLNSGTPDAIKAAQGIHTALSASDEQAAKQAIFAAANERRIAALWNRDCSSTALEHLQGNSPAMKMKRELAASLSGLVPSLGRWLDEGPYGPKSGPPELTTKY